MDLSRRLGARAFLVALGLGLLLRVAPLPLAGTEDVNVWKVWSFNGSRHVTAVYGVGGNPPVRGMLKYGRTYTTVDYPPVAIYELSLVGFVYRAIFPSYPDGPTLHAALKLPGLVAGAALTWLVFVTMLAGSEATLAIASDDPDAHERRARARAAALAIWLNPALILNSEILGYLDPLVMLPSLAAFILLARARPRPLAAGACLAIALLTKPQALLMVPAWTFLLWTVGRRRANHTSAANAANDPSRTNTTTSTTTSTRESAWRLWSGAVAGATIAGGLAVLPFALVGALPNMWLAFGSFYARRDILSGNAANIWWIANYLSRAIHGMADLGWQAFFVPVARVMAVSTFMEQGLPNPRPFGQAAIALAVGWAFWRLRRRLDLAGALLLAAFTVHAVFVLGVGIHEHHQVLMVPLLALAAALRPRLRGLFVAASAICALNMYLFYGFGRGWPPVLPRTATGIDATVLLSIANLLALVWHARLLAREADAPAPAATRQPAAAAASAPFATGQADVN